MATPATNNQPMPDFLGVPWGASQEVARRTMEAREGVLFASEPSGESSLYFHGGVFANKDVSLWLLQFVDDQLHTARILVAPPKSLAIAEFEDLRARLTREYGEPAQGGLMVNPPFRKGQEMEAIAEGQGLAAALYAFGKGNDVEGSILCQVAPTGQIITTYQHQRLNMQALSSQSGLDAPIEGLPSMQPQAGDGRKGGCFVATATLSDPHHPVLYALRRYRDGVLMTTLPGKVSIRIYYAAAPIIARGIESSPLLRGMTYRKLILPGYKRALRRFAVTR